MKKWLIATMATIAMLWSTVALARPLTLNEISEASCRVKTGSWQEQSAGTGTCIGETPDGQSFYVLTNAHVVGQSRQGTVEFFKGGYKTMPLPATVVWRAYQKGKDVDFALLTVNKSLFGNHPPRVIPIAPEGYRPQPGHYIAAVGCPSARWAQGWEGRITEDRQSRVMFVPAPVGGQSGSGVTVLVQGKDGEWYTRVGAVLTWRIGDNPSNVQGGAIPVGTLYNVLNQRHQARQMPVNYREVAQKYALGSDGNHYPIFLDYDGHKTVRFGNSTGVQIVSWAGCNRPNCPNCRPSSGSFPPYSWRAPSPQPSPQPQPRPGVPPYTQPGNPYGVNPPSIGAPWPGAVAPKPEEKPEVEEEPKADEPPKNADGVVLPPLSEELDELGQKYNALAAEKKAIEEKLAVMESDILDQATKDQEEAQAAYEAKLKAEAEAAAAHQAMLDAEAQQESEEVVAVVEQPKGLFARLKDSVNGFVGGILMGAGLGLLVFVWNKFLKKRVIQRIDSLQDYLEAQIKKKWGPELAKEARDVMEGVEDALLGFADDFLEDMQARKQVAKANATGKPAERVENGSGIQKRVNVKEILEAVRVASEEVGDDNVTTAVPEKVDEILNRVANAKRNGS